MTVIPVLDTPAPRQAKTYHTLRGALERLLDDDPQSAELRALREEADEDGRTRPVPITQINVAIESGKRSRRKLISGDRCDFPLLAAYIVSLRSTHGVSQNTTERLRRQAEDIATLDQRVRVLRSRILVAIQDKDAAERLLLEAEDQIGRLKKRFAA